ncbi:MAG: hypothetical protein ACRD0U_00920, partial [Acidimicrobiales bacterium]
MAHRTRSRLTAVSAGVFALGLVPSAARAAERTPDDELLHEIEIQLEADAVTGEDLDANGVED